MELHELDVSDGDPGPQGHGHAVTGRLGRVGGDGEELPGTAGGQHHVVGPDLDRRTVRRTGDDAPAPSVLDQEIEREPSLEDGAGSPVGGLDQSPLHLGPGRRPSGMDHARVGVPTLAGQSQEPAGLPIEVHPERDQLMDPARALVDQNPHRLLVAEPGAGGQRVGQMQIGRVLVPSQYGGHAALGPPGGRLRERALRQHAQRRRLRRRLRQRRHRSRSGQADGGREPGHPAPEDQDIERARPTHPA